MAIIPQPDLFSWDHVDASSEMDRLRWVLDAMPDEPLMCALEAARKGRRNDYPIRPVWNSVIAGIVFQHNGVESLRRELARNGDKHRTAVERVNSRIDLSFGFDHHFIRGMKKMRLRLGLALVVMLAMAVGRIRADQREHLRSLVKPAA